MSFRDRMSDMVLKRTPVPRYKSDLVGVGRWCWFYNSQGETYGALYTNDREVCSFWATLPDWANPVYAALKEASDAKYSASEAFEHLMTQFVPGPVLFGDLPDLHNVLKQG